MAIDIVGSAGASALQPFQPRPVNNDTGTDNRSVQQFQQLLKSPSSAQPSETQTEVAVQQPEPPQNAPAPRPPAGNAAGNGALSLSEILEQANQRQTSRDEQPPSALSYNANGSSNSAQRPTQAGQLVSLSV